MESSKHNPNKQSTPYRPPKHGKQKNMTSKSTPAPSSKSNDELDIMEKRRLRFQKSNSPQTGFGLVSRGEDLTLRDSPAARIKLFKDIKADLVKFESDDSLKDKILMSFRKLREGIIAGKETNVSLKRDALLASFNFSINVGHYQSYLPSINQLLYDKDDLQLKTEDIDSIVLCYCIHLSHYESNHEAAMNKLLMRFKVRNYPIMKPTEVYEIIYNLIVCEITGNSIEWMDNFNKLQKNSIYSNFLKSIALERHQNNSLKIVTKCYKIIPASNFKNWTDIDPETINNFQNFKISVNVDKIVKFQREIQS